MALLVAYRVPMNAPNNAHCRVCHKTSQAYKSFSEAKRGQFQHKSTISCLLVHRVCMYMYKACTMQLFSVYNFTHWTYLLDTLDAMMVAGTTSRSGVVYRIALIPAGLRHLPRKCGQDGELSCGLTSASNGHEAEFACRVRT